MLQRKTTEIRNGIYITEKAALPDKIKIALKSCTQFISFAFACVTKRIHGKNMQDLLSSEEYDIFFNARLSL